LNGKDRPHLAAGGELPLAGDDLAGLMRAILEKGKLFRFEARGTSMRPFIQDGDVVTISPLAGSGPKVGDVVAFVHPGTGRVPVHRIVRAGSGRFLVKGDNGLIDDGALARESILGVLVRLERSGRARRLGPAFLSAAIARLSRSYWLTRLARRTRRAFSRGEGKA
jgi:hypothetical protein